MKSFQTFILALATSTFTASSQYQWCPVTSLGDCNAYEETTSFGNNLDGCVCQDPNNCNEETEGSLTLCEGIPEKIELPNPFPYTKTVHERTGAVCMDGYCDMPNCESDCRCNGGYCSMPKCK